MSSKRTKHSPEFKAKVALATIKNGETVTQQLILSLFYLSNALNQHSSVGRPLPNQPAPHTLSAPEQLLFR
jgi:hypothetical protein